jgi:hypothetical protein
VDNMAGFFDIQVIDEGVNAQLEKIRQMAGPAAQRILVQVASAVESEMKNLVPVDMGNLKASIQTVTESRDVTAVIEQKDGSSRTVGGPVEVGPTEVAVVAGADYAAAVNCDENANHEEHGGQAHFAETALQNVGRNLPGKLSALLQSVGLNPL